jgi:rhodanese-related sulfurtransferase
MQMSGRKLVTIPMVVVLVFFAVFLLAAPPLADADPPVKGTQFEMIREAINAWLGKETRTEITAEELFGLLSDDKPMNDPFIVDLRYLDSALPDVYVKAHIPGAVNIPWRNILKKENLAKLPKDRMIVVYCYNGHIGSQIAPVLNLSGFDARNLRWGFTSYACDKEKIQGEYAEKEDCQAYPVETTPRSADASYPFPTPGAGPGHLSEVLISAGDAWLSSNKPGEISNEEVFERMSSSDPEQEAFIIDVRKKEDYSQGHIRGAINIPINELAKHETLKKLPPDKQIVVCGYVGGDVGGEATAMLNVLGYSAVNLKWGMTSWTFDSRIAPNRYQKAKDCMNYRYVTGSSPNIKTAVY